MTMVLASSLNSVLWRKFLKRLLSFAFLTFCGYLLGDGQRLSAQGLDSGDTSQTDGGNDSGACVDSDTVSSCPDLLGAVGPTQIKSLFDELVGNNDADACNELPSAEGSSMNFQGESSDGTFRWSGNYIRMNQQCSLQRLQLYLKNGALVNVEEDEVGESLCQGQCRFKRKDLLVAQFFLTIKITSATPPRADELKVVVPEKSGSFWLTTLPRIEVGCCQNQSKCKIVPGKTASEIKEYSKLSSALREVYAEWIEAGRLSASRASIPTPVCEKSTSTLLSGADLPPNQRPTFCDSRYENHVGKTRSAQYYKFDSPRWYLGSQGLISISAPYCNDLYDRERGSSPQPVHQAQWWE